MLMKDYKSLKALDYFRWVFERFNIDYVSMRKILQLKLTMDTRRTHAMFNSQQTKKEKNQFLHSLWIYVIYGGIGMTSFLFLPSQYMLPMGIIFTILMFIAMTAMVSDFSAVLLDLRDKNILQPKPISNRTLNAAKIMHIVIYLAMLNGALIAVPSHYWHNSLWTSFWSAIYCNGSITKLFYSGINSIDLFIYFTFL